MCRSTSWGWKCFTSSASITGGGGGAGAQGELPTKLSTRFPDIVNLPGPPRWMRPEESWGSDRPAGVRGGAGGKPESASSSPGNAGERNSAGTGLNAARGPPSRSHSSFRGRQCPHLCLLSFLASCHPFQSAPHACSRIFSTSQGARGPGSLPETPALPWPPVWPHISISASGPSPAHTAVAEVPGQVALGAAEREPVHPGVEAGKQRRDPGARCGCSLHGGGAGCWARCWETELEWLGDPMGRVRGTGRGGAACWGRCPQTRRAFSRCELGCGALPACLQLVDWDLGRLNWGWGASMIKSRQKIRLKVDVHVQYTFCFKRLWTLQ